MIFDKCKWDTHDVPAGAIIYVPDGIVDYQQVQWMVWADRFGELTGYIN